MINLWVWEVDDEVEPIVIYLSNPWELLLRYAYMPCYARRRGLGLSVSMTDVRLLING